MCEVQVKAKVIRGCDPALKPTCVGEREREVCIVWAGKQFTSPRHSSRTLIHVCTGMQLGLIQAATCTAVLPVPVLPPHRQGGWT